MKLIYSWRESLAAFWEKRILSIFLFGFSSGIPFLLTLSTLSIWLKESGVNNTTIGLFVITTIPYTFKFLWGPLVDRVRLPFLFPLLGQRRSWAFLAQVLLIVALLGLGISDPRQHILDTAAWAFAVTFFSALQDIILEAYRIEVIDESQKGAAATSTYLGYRLGMMMSGYGALHLATTFSWQTSYRIMAILIGIGLLTTLLSPSPKSLIFSPAPHLSLKNFAYPRPRRIWKWFSSTYGGPFKDLLRTYDWRIVLAFIFFYKVGDTILNVMTMPFLIELGFSTSEIADIAKLFGITAMIFGGFIGGLFLNRYGIFPSLLLCAVLQIVSSLMFIIQAMIGYGLGFLVLTMGIENFSCGFGAAAFIAYLSSLCSVPHTATHFALLSSFGSMARIILSIGAGFLADLLPWPLFFVFTAIACLPCLLILVHASHHFSYAHSFLKPASQS